MAKSNGPNSITNRRGDWISFGAKVGEHIDTYIVPEGGDRSDDEVEECPVDYFMGMIKELSTFLGKGSNSTQDKFNCIKIAYFAQLAYRKLEREEIGNGNG